MKNQCKPIGGRVPTNSRQLGKDGGNFGHQEIARGRTKSLKLINPQWKIMKAENHTPLFYNVYRYIYITTSSPYRMRVNSDVYYTYLVSDWVNTDCIRKYEMEKKIYYRYMYYVWCTFFYTRRETMVCVCVWTHNGRIRFFVPIFAHFTITFSWIFLRPLLL